MTSRDERPPSGEPEQNGVTERPLTRRKFVATAVGAAAAMTPMLGGVARAVAAVR